MDKKSDENSLGKNFSLAFLTVPSKSRSLKSLEKSLSCHDAFQGPSTSTRALLPKQQMNKD